MSALEFIVLLAASPIVAALLYGTWKFSSEADIKARSLAKPTDKPFRYSGMERAL